MQVKAWSRALPVLLILFLITACTQLIGSYNEEAYRNATSLKAEAMAMVDRAATPYSQNVKDVDTLTVRINAAYEYSAGLPSNQLSAQQWQILRDPDGAFWGAFVRTWKSQGKLSDAFRPEFKRKLGQAFDQIICLETTKQTVGKACTGA